MNAQRLKAAAAALGLLAGLTLAPIVIEGAAPVPVSAVASAVDSAGARSSLHAGFAPAAKTGDHPLRRRRIHWNDWTHYVGGGGRFSWLVFGPITAVVLASAAVPLYLRSRLKKRRPKTRGSRASAATVPRADDRLEKLSELHASGALTDEEFLTQRRRILGE